MNKFQLERTKAFRLASELKQSGGTGRPGAQPPTDRRAQRKMDQAAGLVPFPLKLSQAQADRLRALALERGMPTNEVVAELLDKALQA